MNLEDFTKQTRMESEKPSGWAYDFEAMKAYEKERMKSAEEFSMGILDEERKVTEEGLKTDKLFLDATKIAYKQMYGKMLEGSEEEIASQGMQLVSDALIPLTTVEGAGMLGIYKHFNEAHPEAKQALYYMIDSIDKKDMTFDGFMRGVKSIGKDPTTYTGVGLTYSFFGKTAAKASAKKELMKMLGEASLAGGAYMGAEEGLRQDLQGKQDLGEIATQSGIGAVAAPVMIGGVKALGAGGKKALTGVADFMQNTEQEMMRMAGGGTPPQEPLHVNRDKKFKEWFEYSEAVDEKGNPKTLYHGTGADFSEFDLDKIGKGNDQYGSGFYFTDNPKETDLYAGAVVGKNKPNVIPVNLSIQKPLIVDDSKGEAISKKTINKEQIKKLLKSSPLYKQTIREFGDVGYLGEEKVLRDTIDAFYGMDDFRLMNAINNDFYPGYEGEFVGKFETITGYDGVKVTKQTGDTNYVMFDPKKIKSIHNSGKYSKKEADMLKGVAVGTAGASIAKDDNE